MTTLAPVHMPDAARAQLESLLSEHGMLQHMTTLLQHELDVPALRLCDEAGLAEIGLPLGARKKLITALKVDGALKAPADQSESELSQGLLG